MKTLEQFSAFNDTLTPAELESVQGGGGKLTQVGGVTFYNFEDSINGSRYTSSYMIAGNHGFTTRSLDGHGSMEVF